MKRQSKLYFTDGIAIPNKILYCGIIETENEVVLERSGSACGF